VTGNAWAGVCRTSAFGPCLRAGLCALFISRNVDLQSETESGFVLIATTKPGDRHVMRGSKLQLIQYHLRYLGSGDFSRSLRAKLLMYSNTAGLAEVRFPRLTVLIEPPCPFT